jgi:hypothetical protein
MATAPTTAELVARMNRAIEAARVKILTGGKR